MKLQASELRRYSSKLTPLTALAFSLIILPIYYLFYNKNLSSQIGYQHQENAINPPPEPNNPTWRRSGINGGDASPPNPSQREAITAANQTVAKTPEPDQRESPGQARTGSTRRPESNGNGSVIRSEGWRDKKCDLFNGEWTPNPEGPYYTNETCGDILEPQNCMKFGRPDTGFLRWRWKPDECELPVFDPVEFLEMVRGKSILFVGDSVARNHMHSLICLLSRVARPVDSSEPLGENMYYQYVVNKHYQYEEYSFNISFQWSPFLVKIDKVHPSKNGPFYLHLDEFDESWTTKLALHDYAVISAGHWFPRPSYLHLHGRLHGCVYCSEPESNITHLPPEFSYRRAFRTAFRAINDAVGFDGVTFVRTFAPHHFEGGAWDKGGDCPRRRPFMRNESEVEAARGGLEFYAVQLEEMRVAEKAGRRNRGKFVLLDATKPMRLRPDGHPSKYGHSPEEKWAMPNDCVHWCLPGPIDAWSDFLQELLKREIGDGKWPI